MIYLIGVPLALIGGMYLGRLYQRRIWGLDKPYEDRPTGALSLGGLL